MRRFDNATECQPGFQTQDCRSHLYERKRRRETIEKARTRKQLAAKSETLQQKMFLSRRQAESRQRTAALQRAHTCKTLASACHCGRKLWFFSATQLNNVGS
jgi:hypothetical protein